MTESNPWTVEGAIPAPIRDRIARLGRINAPPEAYMAAFMELVGLLKTTARTGWVDRDLPNPEHIGDHMYRMAVITMMTGNSDLDVRKCMQIALVHDMAECIVGDITPYDLGVTAAEKHRREHETMKYLRDLVAEFNPVAAEPLYDYWVEYETQSTPEARFVKDVDKLELLYQSNEYTRMHPTIDLTDFEKVSKLIKSDEGKRWANGLGVYSSTETQGN